PCVRADEYVCQDDTTMLECHRGAWAAHTCRGEHGCTKDVGIVCDEGPAKIGDPCVRDTDYACTADRSASLRCVDRKWALLSNCRGTAGCTPTRVNVSCDETAAIEGEACSRLAPNSCSVDKKAKLACKDGTWALTRVCLGPGGCATASVDRLTCDD